MNKKLIENQINKKFSQELKEKLSQQIGETLWWKLDVNICVGLKHILWWNIWYKLVYRMCIKLNNQEIIISRHLNSLMWKIHKNINKKLGEDTTNKLFLKLSEELEDKLYHKFGLPFERKLHMTLWNEVKKEIGIKF
jgi:hypothetical protein